VLALAAAALLPALALAKVGRTKLSPEGLETSQMGLGGLHFAELDGTCAQCWVDDGGCGGAVGCGGGGGGGGSSPCLLVSPLPD
jgi:hypothetical protein